MVQIDDAAEDEGYRTHDGRPGAERRGLNDDVARRLAEGPGVDRLPDPVEEDVSG